MPVRSQKTSARPVPTTESTASTLYSGLALLPVLAIFLVWDVIGIVRGHWWYSETYTTGILFPLDVPLEEVVFFVVIPICGLLTYEAVGTVLGWWREWRARDA